MRAVVAKAETAAIPADPVTERGFSFGYNNLVSDMRSLVIMRGFGYPVVFDASHTVQLRAAGGERSGGQREFIAPLARAAVAAGVDALFMEVHEDPDNALSDGPNSYPLERCRRCSTTSRESTLARERPQAAANQIAAHQGSARRRESSVRLEGAGG